MQDTERQALQRAMEDLADACARAQELDSSVYDAMCEHVGVEIDLVREATASVLMARNNLKEAKGWTEGFLHGMLFQQLMAHDREV